jgi:H+/Cl- antiporter ClcA
MNTNNYEQKKKKLQTQLSVISVVITVLAFGSMGVESYYQSNPSVEELYNNEAQRAIIMWSIVGPILVGLLAALFGLVMKLRRLEKEQSLSTLVNAITDSKSATQIQMSYSADRPCPWCAETIKESAIICRYCGRDIEPIRNR